MTFVTEKKPYTESSNTEQEKKEDSNSNNNITTTTHSTKLDQNPEDYKSNYNSQCPEQQKV